MSVTFETFDPCDPRSPKMVASAVKLAKSYSGRVKFDAEQAKRLLGELRDQGLWELADESEWGDYAGERTWAAFCANVLAAPQSWADFLIDHVVPGVGYTQAQEQHRRAVELAEQARPLAAPRRPTRAEVEERGDKGSHRTLTSKGETADYLTRRIARDRPDLLERMKAGEFRSVRAAALEAGIVKPRWSAPVDPFELGRALQRRYTADEWERFERGRVSEDEN